MNHFFDPRGLQTLEIEKHAGYDVSLLLTTLLLCICGAIFVLTSSAVHSWQVFAGDSQAIFWNHLTRLGLGLVAMIAMSFVNYHLYERLARPLVVASLALLVAVLILPQPAGATAKRWIYLAGFSFQPAEVAKFSIISYLAMRFAALREEPFAVDRNKTFWGGMLITGLLVGMIVIEPNLSMALLVAGIAMMMFFAAGVPLRSLILPGLLGLCAFGAIAALNPYMQSRLTAFVAGIADPMKSSYHVKQSLIGIGHGGLTGVGLGQSTQKHFFLPEPYNDFIFSIIGEELGFVGTVGLILCFVFLLTRGWKIARNAPDAFGYFVAAGITFAFAISFMINVGVTLGLLPATGQPLPFISYGGTSLIMSLAAIGVLLNISRQSQAKKSLLYSFNASGKLR